jgi:hypothetical protein
MKTILTVLKRAGLSAVLAVVVACLLPAGCRTVLASNGTSGQVCWGTDATGSGLITADAALNATP